jgi:hypothetical protein
VRSDRVSAVRISRPARARLDGGARAVVVGVQRRACQLALEPDGLLVLSAADVPLAPCGIAADAVPDGLRVGQRVALGARGSVGAAADWLVDLHAAAVRDPRPRVGSVPRGELEDGLGTARGTAIAEGRARSLLPLLWGSAGDTLAGRPAGLAARRLADGAIRGHLASVAAAAAGLAGLGPGLTPSGDDLLAGFVAAWTLVGQSLRCDRESREGVASALLAGARPGASPLGRAWLEHAVRGELPEPMTRFAEALFAADPGDLVPAVRRVLAVGASSGTDWSAGFLLGAGAVLDAAPWS